MADVVKALDNNDGIVDAALLELQKNQLKPFLMRIWGPPVGVENDGAAPQGGQSVYSLRYINYEATYARRTRKKILRIIKLYTNNY